MEGEKTYANYIFYFPFTKLCNAMFSVGKTITSIGVLPSVLSTLFKTTNLLEITNSSIHIVT